MINGALPCKGPRSDPACSRICRSFVLGVTSAFADTNTPLFAEVEIKYSPSNGIGPFGKDSPPILQIAQTSGQVIMAHELVMLLIA